MKSRNLKPKENPLKGVNVILVEDEEIVAELYSRILQPIASKILVAHNLDELRMHLQQLTPDAVLLDLRLRETGPEEALREIKNIRQVNPNAVVVVASGLSDPAVIRQAMDQGADYFAVKPETNTESGLLGAILKGLADKARTARTLELIEKLTNQMKKRV